MRKWILWSVLALMTLTTNAQMNATTEDGRAVLLMRDGTWRFADQPAAPASYDCNSLTSQGDGDKSSAKSPVRARGARGSSVGFYPQKEGEYVTMLIDLKGDESCMVTGSVMNFTFRDGTIVDLKNSGDANCDGRGLLTLGVNEKSNKLLSLLKNKEIATVRVWSKSLSTLVTFDPEQSKLLMNTYWCLLGR